MDKNAFIRDGRIVAGDSDTNHFCVQFAILDGVQVTMGAGFGAYLDAAFPAPQPARDVAGLGIANRLLACIHNGTMHEYRQIAIQEAEDLARAHVALATALRNAQDHPDMDATDFAHPAWWRGHDHAFDMFCLHVNKILDGKDDGKGENAEGPWRELRKRLLALRDAEAARVKAEGERDALLPRPRSEVNMLGLLAGAATTKLHEVMQERDTLRAQLDAVTRERDEAIARAEQAERNEAACRAALEEIGYTGALPEGAYDKLVRERDEALAELAGLGPVELEVNGGEGWGACTESTFNRLSEKGWKKRRIRVVQEHSNA